MSESAAETLWKEIVKVVRNGHQPDIDAVKAKYDFGMAGYVPPAPPPADPAPETPAAEATAADNAG